MSPGQQQEVPEEEIKLAINQAVLSDSYFACVDHNVQQLFLALPATMNYQLYGGYATNSYAHPPADFKKPPLVSFDIILSTKLEDDSTVDDVSIYTNCATFFFQGYFTHAMLITCGLQQTLIVSSFMSVFL